MNIQDLLEVKVTELVFNVFQLACPMWSFQPTRKDFEGDLLLLFFPCFV